MKSILLKSVSAIIDNIFPSHCIYCGLTISYNQNWLCDTCLEKLIYIKKKCDICSGVIVDDMCTICSDRKLYYTKNICIAEYTGVMKEILHNLKFNKKKRIYHHLSDIAFKNLMEDKGHFDIITSVPMNRKKKWERGYNQSEIIAKRLSHMLKIKYIPLLTEKTRFKTQRDLGFRERFINILNRYKIRNKNKINDKRILLVDDIFTTGATINECARILKSFNAKDVYSLTMARTNIKIVDFN